MDATILCLELAIAKMELASHQMEGVICYLEFASHKMEGTIV